MPQTPGEPPGATPAREPAAVPPRAPADEHDAEPAARRPHQMPPWLPRAFALAGASVLAFLACLWLLERLRGLLLLLLISLFLAFAIEPAVNWLAARGWRRGVATAAMFVIVGLLIAGFLGGIGSLLAAQANHLISGFPEYVRRFVGWVNATFGTHLSQRTVFQRLPTVTDALSRHLADLAGNVWGFGTTAFGVVFNTLGVLLFTFYLSAEGPRFRRTVCSLLPPRRQHEVLRAWEIAVDKTGGYIYSRGLLALISGIAHYAAMAGLGVPYAAALALWVGVISQFIPAVGTYLAGAVPVLIALTKSPSTALWILLFIIAYQQLENYLLQPRITARTLDTHPAVAFGLILAGAAVAGPVGILLAIPLGASLQAFASAYVRRYEVEEHPLTKPDPPPGRWWRWLRR
ncbi:putative PurR-regulated permease PerM [Actinomadura coerulea]|uniref:Putative PurR-regulated permease PerM n=1 Tax=Actinomadura coerulea TaxID=46159 RepID=A0A7X0FWB4_9ACTN|nr:AI-2E family transporter [Actinomadura coerulea]MBB6394899.1 putative PurR-regulated permease PerM [Actinomadura coerulea]GGQ31310.1 AI-2E family transporter [Actinomadura coerulea]